MKRALAAGHLLLISPAVLFLVAVMVQHLPLQVTHTTQSIVIWYAERMWTLWMLLLALPLSVFISGCILLLKDSSGSATVANLAQKALTAFYPPAGVKTTVAVTTATAGVIVGIVILHMLAN